MKTNTDKTIITMAIIKIEDEYQGLYYIDGKLDENKTVYEDEELECWFTVEATFYKLYDLILKNIENSDENIGKLFDSVTKTRHPKSWEIQAYSSLIPKSWK